MTPVQFWGQTATIVIAIIGAIVYQTHYIDRRIDDLRSEMKAGFESLRELIRSEIRRLEDRIERLEHPVTRSH